jgi:uncharacterized protein YodC (DUF2158 family)
MFKVGDTVRLKSGGPLMTVTAVDTQDQKIWCSWFDKANKENQGHYPAAAVNADDGDPVIA